MNIGKRLPFQVKRCDIGKGVYDVDYRYSQQGRTFMVERIDIHNKIYGTAYGYLMVDGIRDDNNLYMGNYEAETVPCAGCGGWVLIDVPGVDVNTLFPKHKPDYLLPFGKYKGLSISDIYKIDPKYVFWLAESDRYFSIDFHALLTIDPQDPNAQKIFQEEYNRVFPKTTVDDIISFGKYKGATFKEIIHRDCNYVLWVISNSNNLDFDEDSFKEEFDKIRQIK